MSTELLPHLESFAEAADRFKRSTGHDAFGAACTAFIRMGRLHEAREDPVSFPALRKVLPAGEIKDPVEEFEREEDEQFAEGVFEKAAEHQLGIYDPEQLTVE